MGGTSLLNKTAEIKFAVLQCKALWLRRIYFAPLLPLQHNGEQLEGSNIMAHTIPEYTFVPLLQLMCRYWHSPAHMRRSDVIAASANNSAGAHDTRK